MSFARTVPALPVRDMPAAIAFYETRYGFDVIHADEGFARLNRDDAQLHLWLAGDTSWRTRQDFAREPIQSGAEDFIAGTASCRIDVDSADDVFTEMQTGRRPALHPRDGAKATAWGTREVDTLDLDGNLLTFVERLG